MQTAGDGGFESGGAIRLRYGPRLTRKALQVAALLSVLLVLVVVVALVPRETTPPSEPGPLAGSWRVVTGALPKGAMTLTFTPGKAATDRDETDAVFQVAPDGKKAVVKRQGQPDLVLELPEKNVATGAGGLYLLKVMSQVPTTPAPAKPGNP